MKLGDVIFSDLPKIPIWLFRLVSLIFQVQKNSGPEHCGICTEAFVFGVWTIPLPLFWLRWPFNVTVKTWDIPAIAPLVVNWVLAKKGVPYNIHYSDSDNAYYCSSLIAKAYEASCGVKWSTSKTVKEVELSDPPAVTFYQKILNSLPDPTWRIWLVKDLMEGSELV